MKKLALTIAIVLGFCFSTFAQTENAGGLFQYGNTNEEEEYIGSAWFALDQNNNVNQDEGLFSLLRAGFTPGLPGHNSDQNETAPLGGGALLLIGFGAAYALKKRSKK